RLLLPDMKEGRFPPEKNVEPTPKKDEPKKDESKKDEPKKDEPKKDKTRLSDPQARAAVDELLDLMGQRLALMPEVARAKWNRGLHMEDAVREHAFLKRILAEKTALDPEVARRFFRRAA